MNTKTNLCKTTTLYFSLSASMSASVITRLTKSFNFVSLSNKKKKSLRIGRNLIDEYVIMHSLDDCRDKTL